MCQLQPEFEPANAKLLSKMVFVVNLEANVIFFLIIFLNIRYVLFFYLKRKRKERMALLYVTHTPSLCSTRNEKGWKGTESEFLFSTKR